MTWKLMYDYGQEMSGLGVSYDPTMGVFLGVLATMWTMILIITLISIAYKILVNIARGKLFEKAKQPRWWAFIPFWNIYKTLELIKKGKMFIITIVLSIVLPIVAVMLNMKGFYILVVCSLLVLSIWLYFSSMYLLAKKFSRGTWFALGLMFLPWIFFPILGLSKDSIFETEVVPQPMSPLSPELQSSPLQ